jgi:rare lipoprotein A
VRVQYLARAPLNGDDSFERRYLASQGWAQVASHGRPKDSGAVGSIAAGTRPPQRQLPVVGLAGTPLPQQAGPGAVPQLRWQASTRVPVPPPRREASSGGSFLIQAGSFRSEDNAGRARSLLGAVGPVEVSPVEVGGETLFRVRVGPFADENAASAALARVTEAGYRGAKIVMN